MEHLVQFTISMDDEKITRLVEANAEKIIRKSTWDDIQNEALKRLNENKSAHPDVRAHWQSIVDGVVPFGYKVSDEL